MPVRSRPLTDEERRILLKTDEDRLDERDALALLAQANRSDGFEICGVRFPLTNFRWPKTQFVGTRFLECDLGSPLLTWRPFTQRLFEDCRFSNVRMDGLNVSDCVFRRCGLDRVVFGEKFHGFLGKCRFEDCTFDACTFSFVQVKGCELLRCRVTAGRGTSLLLQECQFTETLIAGSFGLVQFVDSTLQFTDTSGCGFHEASFLSNSYKDVRFPESPNNFFVTVEVLDGFRSQAEKHFSTEGLKWLYGLMTTDKLFPVNRGVLDTFEESEAEELQAFCYPRRIRGSFTLEREA